MGCGCGGSSGLLLKGAGRQVGGGGCPCALGSMGGGYLGVENAKLMAKGRAVGGYRPTASNLKALRKWKRGQSIGFTMRSSLKAKGLIPRANGTRRVSAKYMKRRGTRRRR
jgi:hypothetical protein